jgi:large subunit ribosomal protein L3
MFGELMKVLLGTKLGMSRIFDESGRAIAVTAIQAGTTTVVQVKDVTTDGYTAIQVGMGAQRHPNKPESGHAKALATVPQHLREFRGNTEDSIAGSAFNADAFKTGDLVKLTAVSKGKGFAGVIKKHNFARGPQTHGSDHHRAPGSIGSMFPQHVLKGKKMPGKMGNEQVTVRKVEIVDVLADQNILLVKGPVPGSNGGLVELSLM